MDHSTPLARGEGSEKTLITMSPMNQRVDITENISLGGPQNDIRTEHTTLIAPVSTIQSKKP